MDDLLFAIAHLPRSSRGFVERSSCDRAAVLHDQPMVRPPQHYHHEDRFARQTRPLRRSLSHCKDDMNGEFFLQARFFPNEGFFPLPPAEMREDVGFPVFPIVISCLGDIGIGMIHTHIEIGCISNYHRALQNSAP
ncbi:hypothetical protein HRR83_005800 [Exophiala dermatitidis]|uniref:Uncharacterized protein n=1 Tax=Exophiala dermatitidis TaxID=5970 RepID=A0AAN6IRW3_EXODE|nr:hypothetical protein HRR73_007375 [Exophiala dermatitidis]KAJ4513357.1 hypothetical protein HRR74_006169 [Exophiala dermatitidis]KAJ4538092.1 hypothetical protein HRR77_007132 [Exophiala dermatitidis]KAJ4539825.1 hypothetical protein HRR76_003259 [Exophiala dermatitidis]KAJ4562384.1 hypothetical protein HRR79_006711 [Exophiala dermatitidis]